MDLTRVDGVDDALAAKLRLAGVTSTAGLARVSNIDKLAGRMGIPATRVDGIREAARQRIIQLFRDAGIPDERALAAGDPAALAKTTGLALEDVEWFQAAAREELARAGPRTRALLRDGRATARVDVDGHVTDDVPIVPARENELLADALARAPGDAVVVASGAAKVVARVGGTTAADVPLYHETDHGLVRVRIDDILEHREKASFLDKLLGRG